MAPTQPTILVIDDDLTQLVILREYLEQKLFYVVTTSSGQQALDYCKDHSPDLILLDLVMPGMDGLETLTHLKLLTAIQNIPVVIITAHHETSKIIESFDAGAVDFITKPIDLLILSKRIEYILHSKRIDSALGTKQHELFENQKHARIGTIKINVKDQSITLSTSCFKEFGLTNPVTNYDFNEFIHHIHEDDKDHVFYTIAHALQKHEDLSLEYRFIADDNSELIFFQHCEFIEDINTQELYLYGSFQDVTSTRAVLDSLDYSKDHDKLTSLPNRTSFQKYLQRLIDNPSHHHLYAIVFIGLDHFTNVNDQFGHSGGDKVLRTIATRLKNIENEGHYISRFSGDIFAVILNRLHHIDECNHIIDNIQTTLKKSINVNDNNIFVTASIGISIFPLESDTTQQLLQSAEAAMMSSRTAGGDRYNYRTHDMNIEKQRRLLLLNELRHALSRNEFVIYYQPQVDAIQKEIIGMEALIRWIHPEHGFIPPDEFIPLAEESDQIIKIGSYVLHEACRNTVRWNNMGYDLSIGVNVSPYQFADPAFLETVKYILKESGLPANKLKVEITETMAVQDPEHTINILNQLRTMGVNTSMDDFGTGYSSLSQLQTLPLDTLKVDQAFVRCISEDLDENDKITYKNSAIANAIIVMAQSLGLDVIAEGVETNEQCQFLKGLNSTILQGYLFSRPLPADKFEELLKNFCI